MDMGPAGRGPVAVGMLELPEERLGRGGETFGMVAGLEAIFAVWWMVMHVTDCRTVWLDWAKKTGGLRLLRLKDS